MARQAALVLLAMTLAGLCACGINARRYPPDYAVPASSEDAVIELHQSLLRAAPSMRNAHVTASDLRWDIPAETEWADAPGSTEITRTLLFAAVTRLTRPVRVDGEWWVRLSAAGGDMSLRFNSPDMAARAVAALRKLCPDAQYVTS